MHKSVFSAPALFLMLGACVTASSQEQIDHVNEAAYACMQRAAAGADDRASDVTSVAYGIVAICQTEVTRSADAISQGNGAENRQYARRKINEASLKAATAIILQERARQRQ